jgi:flotillin
MESILFVMMAVMVTTVVFMLLLVNIWGSMLKKIPPHQALIRYGRGGVSVMTGGAAWVWPFFQRAERLSLEVLPVGLAAGPCVTAEEALVLVRASMLVRVRVERESIIIAARQLVSTTPEQRQALLQPLLKGHLRGVVAQLTPRQLLSEPALVTERMQQASLHTLTSLGLELISCTITDVSEAKGDERAQRSGPLSEALSLEQLERSE